jgi:hypothetical protein
VRGNHRAVLLYNTRHLFMSTPCPMRSFNSPSRSLARSASSAAAATVALPVAGSSDSPLDPAEGAVAENVDGDTAPLHLRSPILHRVKHDADQFVKPSQSRPFYPSCHTVIGRS